MTTPRALATTRCHPQRGTVAGGASSWHSPQREAWGHQGHAAPSPTSGTARPGAGAKSGTKVPLSPPAVGTARGGGTVPGVPPPGWGGVVVGVVVSPMSPYHDGVAGAGGQEDVVGLGGDAIATLDVARHVLPHQLDAGAGTVGA